LVARISLDLLDKSSADERIAVSDELVFAPENLPLAPEPKPIAPVFIRAKPDVKTAFDWAQTNLRTEAEFGTAFLFLPVWLGCGALTYFALETEPGLRPILAICGLVFSLVLLARNTIIPKLVLTAILFGCLGAAAAKLETLRFSTVMMGSEVTTRIAGKLVHAEEITKGRTRLIIDILSTERPKLKFAPERIRVSARGNFSKIEPGSAVSGLVKLFALPGPVRPGGYDFAFESYFDGVGAAGFFLGKPEFAVSAETKTLSQSIDAMRSALTAHIRSIVPGETGAVVAALVTGVRGAVIEADNEALRRSGLAHIMSISGLHLALAAGVLIAAIRLGLALLPQIANVWPVKKMAASAGILMAILYCLLSGSEVATVRSTIMIVVMLGAVLVDRPAITMRNLAIAALILVVIWPHEIAGPGFQMSFAATAGLIAIYRWWASRPAIEKNNQSSLFWRVIAGGKSAVVGTVLSSTVAGLATLPFGAFHFERLAPWGTLSNLLALPAVSIVVMPSAVAAMVAMPFGLDGYIWPVMARGVEFMLWLAHAIAGFGGPDATGPVPVPALLLSTFALVIFCLPQTKLRLLGIAPLLLATVFMVARDEPVAFIEENAGLVAFVTESGALAVNSTRPDDFSVKNWQRTAETNDLLKPVMVTEIAGSIKLDDGFTCSKAFCLAKLPTGLRLAYVKTPESIEVACKLAEIVVQGFAGPPVKCSRRTSVLTSGMFARHGAVAIYADKYAGPNTETFKTAATRWRDVPLNFIQSANTNYRIVWSFPNLERPWQTQRVFSRAARDLAPKPKPEKHIFTGTGLQSRV
jgi:ComEC/Rec2-related protein